MWLKLIQNNNKMGYFVLNENDNIYKPQPFNENNIWEGKISLSFVGYRNLTVKCELPPTTMSSITTTTVSSTAPRLTKTSSESLVSSKESTVAINKKNSVYFDTTYDLNIGTAD